MIQPEKRGLFERFHNPAEDAGAVCAVKTGGTLGPATLIGGRSYAWSQSLIWGTRRVSGATLLSVEDAIAIVETWIGTPMGEARYIRRLAKIRALEKMQ